MSITRYDPFRDLKTLQDEVNRLFSTNFSRGFGDEGIARGAWTPNVDIFENNDLTLRGERRFEKKNEADNYHRVERAYGAFTRSFTLPQTVSGENATAEYKNGVLRVALRKREEVKARRIEVKGESAESPTAKTIEAKPEQQGPAAKGQATSANA